VSGRLLRVSITDSVAPGADKMTDAGRQAASRLALSMPRRRRQPTVTQAPDRAGKATALIVGHPFPVLARGLMPVEQRQHAQVFRAPG
jgi:hypothetical protein